MSSWCDEFGGNVQLYVICITMEMETVVTDDFATRVLPCRLCGQCFLAFIQIPKSGFLVRSIWMTQTQGFKCESHGFRGEDTGEATDQSKDWKVSQ